MAKKRSRSPKTIGKNPLDQLLSPSKGGKKKKTPRAEVHPELGDALLAPKKLGLLGRLKSFLGH